MEKVKVFSGKHKDNEGFGALAQEINDWYSENPEVEVISRQTHVGECLVCTVAIFYREKKTA